MTAPDDINRIIREAVAALEAADEALRIQIRIREAADEAFLEHDGDPEWLADRIKAITNGRNEP